MANILVIGSLNTDYVISVDKIVSKGETILGHSSEKHFGGKGANQAVALARLGASVTMIGAVGDDQEGRALKSALKTEGIDVSHIQSIDTPSGKAFIQRTKDDNAIVVAPGANTAFDLDLDSIDFTRYDMLVLQNEISHALNRKIIEKAHELDVKVLYNPAPAIKTNHTLLEKIDILVLNESEAALITGIQTDSKARIENALRTLYDRVKEAVILTRGANGASYAFDGLFHHLRAYTVDVLDTTGSGDSSVAGLAYSLIKGKNMNECVNFAQKCGALAATKKGAQPSLPTLEEVLETKLLK